MSAIERLFELADTLTDPGAGPLLRGLLCRLSEEELAKIGRVASAGDAQCAGMHWKPIETAPRDGTWVLVWEQYINTEYHPAEVARFMTDRWTNSGSKSIPNASHWMPLPARPGAVTEGMREKPLQLVIRRNEDGLIDEVVGEVRFVHVEQMDDHSWFIAFDTPDGAQQRFWLGSKNRTSKVVFRYDETIPSQHPSTHRASGDAV